MKGPKTLSKESFQKWTSELGPIGFSEKGAQTKIVSFGLKGGESKILRTDGKGFLKSFTDKFSSSLGQSAEEIIVKDKDTILEECLRLGEAEKQLKQANEIAVEK